VVNTDFYGGDTGGDGEREHSMHGACCC